MRKLLLLTALCAGFTSPAHAFKPDLHYEFTLAAFDKYVELCPTGIPLDRRASLRESFAAGTKAEDADLTRLGSRATNWHFYNRDSIPPLWWANTTLEKVYERRVKRLHKLLARKPGAADTDKHLGKVFRQAGRVLHYVEDMSAPAHVIPVFHGFTIPDDFDEYQPRDAAALRRKLTREDCTRITKEQRAQDLKDLINATAKETLVAIGQEGTAAEETRQLWSKYWGNPQVEAERSKHLDKFATYKDCKFKRSEGETGSSDCASDLQLEEFFAKRYLRVMEDTFRMLRYLEPVWKAD
jgi:hypothetical protein